MTDRFSVLVHRETSLVRISTYGFFSMADAEALRDRLVAAYRGLRCPPNRHRTLVDVRAMAIQSQDTLALFAGVLARPDMKARALAVVVSKSLARMQMGRITQGRDAHFFTDPGEAERWLAAQVAVPA